MRGLVLLLLFSIIPLVIAQATAQAPATVQTGAEEPPASEAQLSPQAAYDRATRPLEIIRRSPQNWSEVELSALKAARAQAGVACAARNPDQLAGEDLIAMAHLCAFAQLWQPVHQAASNYLAAVQNGPPPSEPKGLTNLSMAFDYKVQASLNLDQSDEALLTTQNMLRTVPYDEFCSEASNSTLRYIHFIHPDQALALLAQRQPIVLALIKAEMLKTQNTPAADSASSNPSNPAGSSPSPPVPGPSNAPTSHPPLPVYALYADALAFPTMQQFVNQAKAAAESYAELEAALPANLSSEDGMFIAEKRRQYLLLGTHVPALTAMGSLFSPNATAPDNLNSWFGYASVFLLFPDWCNQCVAMAFNSPPRAKELFDSLHVRFFPLIAQANPPERRAPPAIGDVPLPPGKSGKGQSSSGQTGQQERLHVDQQLTISSTPDARLAGTPTLVVPNETLNAFAAIDFPLIIGVDHSGIIRALQVAPDDALAPGGDVDQMAQHLLATWPPD